MYAIQQLAAVIKSSAIIVHEASVEYLITDSRKIVFPAASLFFAIKSERRDGHDFIAEVYNRGVRNFVVQQEVNSSFYPNANFLVVPDTLLALQEIAAFHRRQFDLPVIGITGSNGKTIVKEWLYQLLNEEYHIVRSPRSYNSQIGVPLSVWQINAQHTLGIFEAGISTVKEMHRLEAIIQPSIGVLTNISDAHNEGFASDEEKLQEKWQLFKHCKAIIYSKDGLPEAPVRKEGKQYISWSRKQDADVIAKTIKHDAFSTEVTINYKNDSFSFQVPFTDAASVDNAITCCCVLLLLGNSAASIKEKMSRLQPVEMRMQLKKAINNCYLLNDSYSNDIASLSIALDYLQQQSGDSNTTVILSDILQAGIPDEQLYKRVAAELQQRNIHRLIGIGSHISVWKQLFEQVLPQAMFFASTESFLQQITSNHFKDEFILLKGARVFAFEQISKWLEQKVHQTVMEINLSAMAFNLKEYQRHLLPATKLMAMVKAFSYGSGSAEVARVLQFHKVDYLAVAYADEGVELRKAGITLPIMVMSADEASFDALVEYHLEPEIYSFNIFQSFKLYLQQQAISLFPVHIKINTGMNRLGFDSNEVPALCQLLQQTNVIAVQSVFSHLAGSESAEDDGFTLHQDALFTKACAQIQQVLSYSFLKHISNSAGIFRHPQLQYDMVRLGIGLYGVDSANDHDVHLQTVATLKSTIAQIRNVKAGETIGYNRRGKVDTDSVIATIRIGYADGFSRKLGNGSGKVYISGKLAPVIGSVCMDMIMVNITGLQNITEGDEVEIFGDHLPIQDVATWAGTIPYEIMTNISQRVKRVYVEE